MTEQELIDKIEEIVGETTELNVYNYTDDEVMALDKALTEISQLIDAFQQNKKEVIENLCD